MNNQDHNLKTEIPKPLSIQNIDMKFITNVYIYKIMKITIENYSVR